LSRSLSSVTGTALESVIILLLTDCVGPWKGGPISDIEFSKMKISGFQSPLENISELKDSNIVISWPVQISDFPLSNIAILSLNIKISLFLNRNIAAKCVSIAYPDLPLPGA